MYNLFEYHNFLYLCSCNFWRNWRTPVSFHVSYIFFDIYLVGNKISLTLYLYDFACNFPLYRLHAYYLLVEYNTQLCTDGVNDVFKTFSGGGRSQNLKNFMSRDVFGWCSTKCIGIMFSWLLPLTTPPSLQNINLHCFTV